MKVLHPEDALKLKFHTYKTTGQTLLEPLAHMWWNWAVQFIPERLSPNVISILGFIVSIGYSLIPIYYAHYNLEAPRWTALVCLIGIFVSQTLDGVDGKQARRTNSSSPFGELLDHGADAITAMFLTVAFYNTIGMQMLPFWMYSLSIGIFTGLYLSNWRTYVSGNFKFYVIDTIEAETVVMIVNLITFLFGYEFWHIKVANFISIGQLTAILTLFLITLALICTSMSVLTVMLENEGRSVAGTSAWSPGLSLVLCLVVSESLVSGLEEEYLERYVSVYALMIAFILSKLCCRLILAYLVKRDFNKWADSAFFGSVLLLINRRLGSYFDENQMLWFCFSLTLADSVIFYVHVYYDFCELLGFSLFRMVSIPHKAKENQ